MAQPGLYFGVTTQRAPPTDRRILFRNTPIAKLCKSLVSLFAGKAAGQSSQRRIRRFKAFIIYKLQRVSRWPLPATAFCAPLASWGWRQVSTTFSTTGHHLGGLCFNPANCHILFIFRGVCGSYLEVTGHIFASLQIARGPRSTRAGRKRMARRSSNTPPTAIPTIRNGSNNSQINGYSTSAKSASGQQNTSRRHHNMKAAMILTPT